MRRSVRLYRAACCSPFRKILAAASTVKLQYGLRRAGCSIEDKARHARRRKLVEDVFGSA